MHRIGVRHITARGFHRLASIIESSAKKNEVLPNAWNEYLSWLSFAVPGMLDRANVDAMAFAMKHLPHDGAMLEIGSFCGLSTCVLAYLRSKYSVAVRFFTCDEWAFEGQQPGKFLDNDVQGVTHDEYRTFVRDSFIRNVKLFCGSDVPHTVEASSDAFFERWRTKQLMTDVFGRGIQLGSPLSFCYIDGNHTYDFAQRDFANTDQFLLPHGFILFDDSGDGSGWEVNHVVKEVLRSGTYRLVTHNPNYLVQKLG